MTSTRRRAVEALEAIDRGQRASDALLVARGGAPLAERDRGFITELVNGVTRRRRTLDHVAAPFVRRQLEPQVRAAVRLGTYQLLDLGTPRHAAVNDTVEATPRRARGLVNAVLRRVADTLEAAAPTWPSPAVEHSYPDWLWDLADQQWGEVGAEALIAMNTPERPSPRDDGYVQGQASRWVVDAIEQLAPEGGRFVELCAAPGGKISGLGQQFQPVVGIELEADRVTALQQTLTQFRPGGFAVQADATRPPLRPEMADVVLVDAPCSGLGALGRRADARWSITPEAVGRLAVVQSDLLVAASRLVRPGGLLIYSVCTWTEEETLGVAAGFEQAQPGLTRCSIEGAQWRPHGPGVIVLPHDHGTDAMAVCAWVVPS